MPFSQRNDEKENVAGGGTKNTDWWPDQLRVDILRQHSVCPILWIKISIMQKLLKASIWKK
jgi:hypothetical protein